MEVSCIFICEFKGKAVGFGWGTTLLIGDGVDELEVFVSMGGWI